MQKETLGEHFVWWNDDLRDELMRYRRVLNAAKSESAMQRYLSANRRLLANTVGGGHGRWVIPQFRFGSQYVSDFVIGEKHSYGHEWLLVEIESPLAKMFTSSGDPSHALIHAIRQIQDWRGWIGKNIDYCSRDRRDGGLGLRDISESAAGLILIGRSAATRESTNQLRRQMCKENRIQIHSYDYLLRAGSGIDAIRSVHMGQVE